MKIPLVIDEKDQKWILLGKILDILAVRRAKQELAKHGILPVRMAGVMLKIALIGIFFSAEISYVLEEMRSRKEFRCFAHVGELSEAPQIYRFLSSFSEEHFVGFVSGVLNSICAKRGRGGALIVDSTELSLDLNWFRRRIRKADLAESEFDWGYSPSKGYYIGYKLTLVIEHPSRKPVAFLLHRGPLNDAKLFKEILQELKRRRIARNGDTIICDKGYYSYRNHLQGIARFKLIPMISAKINFKMERLLGILSYPLPIFTKFNPATEKQFFNRLVKSLRINLENFEVHRHIRSMIEDIFKLAKNALSLKQLHRYTKRSVHKVVCLHVLLVGVVASLGITPKEDLQRLAEWGNLRGRLKNYLYWQF